MGAKSRAHYRTTITTDKAQTFPEPSGTLTQPFITSSCAHYADVLQSYGVWAANLALRQIAIKQPGSTAAAQSQSHYYPIRPVEPLRGTLLPLSPTPR